MQDGYLRTWSWINLDLSSDPSPRRLGTNHLTKELCIMIAEWTTMSSTQEASVALQAWQRQTGPLHRTQNKNNFWISLPWSILELWKRTQTGRNIKHGWMIIYLPHSANCLSECNHSSNDAQAPSLKIGLSNPVRFGTDLRGRDFFKKSLSFQKHVGIQRAICLLKSMMRSSRAGVGCTHVTDVDFWV